MPSVKRASAALLAAALVSVPASVAVLTAVPAAAASAAVVISQVYGGGGNVGATYRNDFIELYNASADPVDVDGWSVQYASAMGTSWQVTRLKGVIGPGRHYLVQEAAGTGGTVDLPDVNVFGTIPMAGANGKVALVSGAAELTCGADCDKAPGVVDFVGYGNANDFETKATPALSNTTAAVRGGADTDDNSADFTVAAPNPRGSGKAGPPPTTIHEIQGAGHVSLHEGRTVKDITGIVTAVGPKGFYFQEPDDEADADPATSEGIYVFTDDKPAGVAVGDAVRVGGTVTEYRSSGSQLSLTELNAPTVTVVGHGNPLPSTVLIGPGGKVAPDLARTDEPGDVEAASAFDPTANALDFYEALEGMLVRVADSEVVGPTNSFNEITVLPGGQGGLRSPRGGVLYGGYADQNGKRIILDDDLAPMPVANVGDRVPGAVDGVMSSGFGNYRIQALRTPAVTSGGITPEVTRADRNGELSIATYNVENLDPSDPDEKFARLAKGIVTNLSSPDIVAVEEIQDNSGGTNDGVVAADQTYGKLIAAIAAAGGPTYDYRQIDPVDGTNGGEKGGNIRVGFLFNEGKGLKFNDRGAGDATTATGVRRHGNRAELTLSPGLIDPANAAFAGSRKPLAGEFTYRGKRIIVIANHFASKGEDQPLMGRYQPPARLSEVQRHAQATAVRGFVDEIKKIDRDAGVVVLGDLNDFEFSTTTDILVGADGWLVDLPRTLAPAERYTYVYQGNSQAIDHILVSRSLSARVDYDIVHVNAEFADQASDHDPQVVRIRH
ncbi:lamin tail domain-containing protein [Microtetraspora glauca]|uniref:Lamin tail domain-containing protein n=1 Tax=Microtetraspora glauca TaxID=1996 RepID=A0ABV3GN41_MICGL